MTLQGEIEAGRSTVKADAYAMSIGEIVNLYRDRELVIRPEFQRLFRWSISKKSRLIESILLGIPLPSIFVMQRHDGVWEVIDGLQRLSTILEFMGELRDEEKGDIMPASELHGTRYLPSLNGLTFEGTDEDSSLTPGQRVSFKRSKLDFKILLPESDEKAKYELFDRLNSGGEAPSAQEVRNCQLIMKNRSFFLWLDELRKDSNFNACALISSRAADEQYDLELVCRFLSLISSTLQELKDMESVDLFLTEKMLSLAGEASFDQASWGKVFRDTFSLLATSLESESFRRYDSTKEKFLGGFSVSAFEAVTVGVATNLQAWQRLEDDPRAASVRERVEAMWSEDFFRSQARGGVRGTTRIPATIPAAKDFFRP
ncbi:DUF262 domain-containing protein [Streptomyces asoensis]|uniref:GmrSD restriction endonucleases N-terminal domain-containing protein n=1 Tax=Streptomyces asoensis TaxID=249586 RepID=A0ABQ3S174_9ACTN|nr:DUF262 domain-containing protein [Streptomyces asoensis]GGQ63085.1 hypothetical protein GCM10010496_28160 [Streptomyces asoensis]GHI61831.1 hypothetical protein Saso_34810 [Streptomyces asoensis]